MLTPGLATGLHLAKKAAENHSIIAKFVLRESTQRPGLQVSLF